MISRLQEKILLRFSRDKKPTDHEISSEWSIENALSLLQRVYNDFESQIEGKYVCDFGCGVGYQSVALAHAAKAGKVLGIDINPKWLREARKLSKEFQGGQHARTIDFTDNIEKTHKGKYDVVISQNSMEHFPYPAGTLKQMKLLLKPEGRLFITFGPPWYAPYGAHMQFFTNLPWVHLLFPEKVIMKVRSRYRADGAEKYEEVESGLNKMSVARFERIIEESGMKIVFKNYECVRGLNFLSKIPLLRELFINHVTVALALVDPDGEPSARARRLLADVFTPLAIAPPVLVRSKNFFVSPAIRANPA